MNTEISYDDIKWVYAVDWYDGILSGVCIWQNKRYYACCVDEVWYETGKIDDEGEKEMTYYRLFHVYDLSLEEWQYEDEKNACFEENVGKHWRFDETGKSRCGIRFVESGKSKIFYEKYPPGKHKGNQHYQQFPVVCWFKH